MQKEKRRSEVKLQNKLIEKIKSAKPLHERLEKNYLMKEAESLE